MDDGTQENVVAEIKTKGPALARSSGHRNSEGRSAIIKHRKKVAHRRKLKRSHANG